MRLTDLANKKTTIISGPYGAGKTNVAVNLAIELAKVHENCVIADLDIVNPYFRSADNAEMLENMGVKTLIPVFANTNVDIPALPEQYNLIFTGDGKAVCDVGGDPDGAAVLGLSHDDYIAAGYNMYFVYNRYRPLTAEPEDAYDMLKAIERTSGLKFSGIINNSHLGYETDESVVKTSLPFAEKLSNLAGIPLVLTTSPEWAYVDGTVKIKDITKKLF